MKSRNLFGSGSSLSLSKARLEAPEKLSFHSVRLRPHWFVDTDSRKFVFANVKWEDENGRSINVKDELLRLDGNNSPPNRDIVKYRLFSIACRQLANNSETNNRFEEASMFRRLAMETEWLEKKTSLRNWMSKSKDRLGQFFFARTANEVEPNLPTNIFGTIRRSADFFIHGLYRWTSYYGENWAWASFVLLLMILIVFPWIYTQTQFQLCPKERPVPMSLAICESNDLQIKKNCQCIKGGLSFGEGSVHSLSTATFQNVDYRKPTTKKGETVVILEKIFAPLQAALLALALRRKFMR